MSRKIYDGRPKADALAVRMAKDRVSGDVRVILRTKDTIYGVGSYLLAATGVFDEEGKLIAYYATRSDGKIKGATLGDINWYIAPKEGQYSITTEEEIASIVKR